MKMKSCVCGKSKPFVECCERFLSGQHHAKTAEQLMRSRFSAYALGGYGEYLMSTWLPSSAHVEFKAWFCTSSNAADMDVMHEKSTFIRIKSRWFYTGVSDR
jgi:SEC-C motif-containing protein